MGRGVFVGMGVLVDVGIGVVVGPQAVDIGTIVDLGGRNMMAKPVPRQKCNSALSKFSSDNRSAGFPKWGGQVVLRDFLQARHAVQPRTADDRQGRLCFHM